MNAKLNLLNSKLLHSARCHAKNRWTSKAQLWFWKTCFYFKLYFAASRKVFMKFHQSLLRMQCDVKSFNRIFASGFAYYRFVLEELGLFWCTELSLAKLNWIEIKIESKWNEWMIVLFINFIPYLLEWMSEWKSAYTPTITQLWS